MNRKFIGKKEKQERLKKLSRTPFEILSERLTAICLSLKEEYPKMFNGIDVILNHIAKLSEIQCKSSNPNALLAGYYVLNYDTLEINSKKFNELIKFDERTKIFSSLNIKKEDIVRYATMWLNILQSHIAEQEDIAKNIVKPDVFEGYKCKECGNIDQNLFRENNITGDIICNNCGTVYATIRV